MRHDSSSRQATRSTTDGRRGVLVAGVALAARLANATVALHAAPALAQSGARGELLRAIRVDDPHALRTALLRGADANMRDELGEPAIVIAARAKSWNAVRALAELRGTELDAATREGVNALMFAALHGELAVVRDLIGRKAEVNRRGWTPLHYAAANGHADVVRLLLEHHAYIDAESPNGTTPLMMAARQAQSTVVRLLIDEGADPTPRNQAGLDAVAYARAGGDPGLAEWLATRTEAFRARYGVPAATPGPGATPSSR